MFRDSRVGCLANRRSFSLDEDETVWAEMVVCKTTG